MANELEKHKKRSAKSVHDNGNEIKLKGACFIATKSDLDEIDATTCWRFLSTHFIPCLPLIMA